MKTLKKFMFFIFLAAGAGFTSCSSDDNVAPGVGPIEPPKALPMGGFSLADRPMAGGTVLVENFTMPNDGWIVVRRDDGHNRPLMSEIISIPEIVSADSYPDYSIQLEENLNLQQGERLWVNLHDDDGDHTFNTADTALGIFDVFSGYTLISDSFIVDLQDP